MPRKSRIDAPGASHHIVIRGIERKAIFRDKQDYNNFIDRLGNIFTDTSTLCYRETGVGSSLSHLRKARPAHYKKGSEDSSYFVVKLFRRIKVVV